MSKIAKLKKDFPGYLFKYLRHYRILLLQIFSTRYTYVLAKMKGVSLDSGCTFFGIPVIRRSPLSEIRIGKKCGFRSDTSSNLVGINRKCIISTFSEDARIVIGENTRLSGTVIGAKESIHIGNNVLCGANVLITDFDWHPILPEERQSGVPKSKPVTIGDNVWLGLNTVVLKGVNIGENTVIGANSMVVKDIPANMIAGGNPCKVIKGLRD